MMRSLPIVSALLGCALQTLAQSDTPTFKAEAKSALVWDADFPGSGHSFIVWDPLTGHEIHKLSSAGIEVSSRVGYERVSPSEAGELLNYTTTIANNTDSEITVQYGGASADGRAALPLWLARTSKDAKKGDRKNIWELGRMRCFKNGFASSENFFSANAPLRIFTVHARVFLRRCLTRLDQDLLTSSDCLLRFLLPHSCGGSVSFLNQFGRLTIGLQQDLLALVRRFLQFGGYLLRVGKSLSNLSSSLFQHLEDRLVGEPLEKKADDGEADDLGNQMRPVHAKGIRELLDLSSAIRFNQKSQSIHSRLSLFAGAGPLALRRDAPLLN